MAIVDYIPLNHSDLENNLYNLLCGQLVFTQTLGPITDEKRQHDWMTTMKYYNSQGLLTINIGLYFQQQPMWSLDTGLTPS